MAAELAKNDSQKFAREKNEFDVVPNAIKNLIDERDQTIKEKIKECPEGSLPKSISKPLRL
jgi:pheromone shutdown protein TraB